MVRGRRARDFHPGKVVETSSADNRFAMTLFFLSRTTGVELLRNYQEELCTIHSIHSLV
jgi:hypothetical protein